MFPNGRMGGGLFPGANINNVNIHINNQVPNHNGYDFGESSSPTLLTPGEQVQQLSYVEEDEDPSSIMTNTMRLINDVLKLDTSSIKIPESKLKPMVSSYFVTDEKTTTPIDNDLKFIRIDISKDKTPTIYVSDMDECPHYDLEMAIHHMYCYCKKIGRKDFILIKEELQSFPIETPYKSGVNGHSLGNVDIKVIYIEN